MITYFDKLGRLLEEEKWIKEFLKGQGYCLICGHDDPLDLEGHHPGRERNDSDFIISSCRNCHGRLSRKQRWWPKESLDWNNPPFVKHAFVLRGLAEILLAKSNFILRHYDIY